MEFRIVKKADYRICSMFLLDRLIKKKAKVLLFTRNSYHRKITDQFRVILNTSRDSTQTMAE